MTCATKPIFIAGRRVLTAAMLAFCPMAAAAGGDVPAHPADPRAMVKLQSDGQQGPAASIEDLAWLEGHWVGQMPEGPVEHVILPARFGHMPGFVRAVNPEGVLFYEISLFAEAGQSVTVRVKHFTSGLAGWEARDAFIDRPLVDRVGDTFYFDGATFARTGLDSFTVYFLNREGSQERDTLVIPFRRK